MSVRVAGARRGPQPKPTELRVLEGNNGRGLGRRRANKREPKPRIGSPTPPRSLDAAMRAVWDEVVLELHEAAPRLLTRLDGGVLRQYCVAAVRHEQAELALSADVDVDGKPKLDRFKVLVASKYAQQMHAAADRLGLSPAARTRLAMPEVGEDDEDRKYLG